MIETRQKVSEIILYVIVSLIFVAQFLIGLTTTSTYISINIFLTILLLFYQKSPFLLKNKKISFILFGALLVACISFFHSKHTPKGAYSIILFWEGIIFILIGVKRINIFYYIRRIIIGFAIFHLLGVFFELLLPSTYLDFMELLPLNVEETGDTIDLSSDGGLRGLSTNTAVPANFFILGVIALWSFNRVKKKEWALFGLLVFGLLLTSKRGPTLFLLMSLFIDFLLKVKNTRFVYKIKLYLSFILIFSILLLGFVFVTNKVNIPLFKAITKTVENYKSGEDISSARFALWAWAITLTKQHPIIGIGWGSFKSTSAGNATRFANCETHNIYLQLLCENGIIGALLFYIVFLYFLYITYKAYCFCLKSNGKHYDLIEPLRFAFMYECYFLLYGLTGNTIYDYFCCLPYFICCAIAARFADLNRCEMLDY